MAMAFAEYFLLTSLSKVIKLLSALETLAFIRDWEYAHSYSPFWSGQWDLNPRHSAWQADILPLNYARIVQLH